MNLLIVDDDPISVKLLRAQLEAEGHAVFEAHDGVDALALLERQRVDAVISDILMPRMDGYRLCYEIRKHARLHDLPVIICTVSFTSPGDEKLALGVGADKYLKKPVSLETLVAALDEVIAMPHAAPQVKALQEVDVLKEYSERLVSKLEEKNTELQAQTEALRQSEERYRLLFERAPDAIFALAPTGAVTSLNHAFETITGWPPAQWVGRLFQEFIHPNDQTRAGELFQLLLRGERAPPFDLRVRTAAGGFRDVEFTGFSSQLSGGRIEVQGIGRDVTERKQADESLRAAEERFRGLVEQSIAGIYVLQDDKFVYVNPRFAEIFGYGSAEEMIGRDKLSVVAEKDRETVAESVRRRTEGEVPNVSYQFTGLRKDGSTIEIGGHGARATQDGRPAVIGLMQDISETMRAEEQRQRYVAQLEKAFMSTVKVATTLSEMRDPYTAGHERRVAEIAVAIAAELGFDARQQEGLRVAGYLHDIGKITIPSEILSKPGKLSAIEFQLIKRHAQASYDVLKEVEFPWPVAQVALQHHERMDGSGYPQGLKGEAILLEARIMAVADVIEAMSSHRPYRPGLGIEAALSEIERGRGSAYDAEVADAALRLFRERHYQLAA